MEATGHYWKNIFAVLAAAGHEVALLNPFVARRFQDSSLERTKIDAIDAQGLARLAFEKRPEPTHLHDEVAEALRELVRHRDRLRQDFDDRVRQLHRLVDLGFPEFNRYVRSLDSMLATCLLAQYPTARAFARATPPGQAALRRPALRRRRTGRATGRGRKDLRRTAPRTRLQAPGRPHLPGPRPLAQTPRRRLSRRRARPETVRQSRQ